MLGWNFPRLTKIREKTVYFMGLPCFQRGAFRMFSEDRLASRVFCSTIVSSKWLNELHDSRERFPALMTQHVGFFKASIGQT